MKERELDERRAGKAEPLRGPERLEWARIALEEAVERMVKHPDESVYVAAVAARFRELDALRGGMERRVVEEQVKATGRPETAAPPEAILCPNCRRFVRLVSQHHTGNEWMCQPRNRVGPAPAPSFLAPSTG